MAYVPRREMNKEFWQQKGKLPLWRIADKIGIHEKTLIAWLRFEMDKDRMSVVLVALKEAKAEVEGY